MIERISYQERVRFDMRLPHRLHRASIVKGNAVDNKRVDREQAIVEQAM
jgi:hypothetical protein